MEMSSDRNYPVTIHLQQLESLPYKIAWDLQESLFTRSVQRKLDRKTDPGLDLPDNYLLTCSHPHVFTLGKSGSDDHLLLNEEQLAARSIEFYRINRGGDITYHGPGQVVGYPIIDLEQFRPDIKAYMHDLEEVMIRTLADYGLTGERIDGAIGIWLDAGHRGKERKICAFGVKTSRWITMHGWALNVNTDLRYFQMIVPCGIPDKGVTSLQRELGREVEEAEVRERILGHFRDVFGVEWAVKSKGKPGGRTKY